MSEHKTSLHHQTLAAMKRTKRTTKRCSRCKEWKSRLLFFKSRNEFDGLNSYCKPCKTLLTRAYRQSGEGRKVMRKSMNLWRLNNPDKLSAYRRKYRRDNPVKCKARGKIGDQIESGKLIRGSCEVCGKKNAEAHHDDHSKPLSVRWLCKKHHSEFHANYEVTE